MQQNHHKLNKNVTLCLTNADYLLYHKQRYFKFNDEEEYAIYSFREGGSPAERLPSSIYRGR